MRKKFIILGLILLFTGSGMLGWVLFEKRKEQQDIAQYKLKYSSETDDYLRQYDQWLQLPPEERTELPLVLDKNGKAKTKSQLQQEQQERLKADLDRLAAGEMIETRSRCVDSAGQRALGRSTWRCLCLQTRSCRWLDGPGSQ